ncbi:sugar transferase [Vibrio cholerae]|uniref:sugar transferase n=1 Tax=Vibrio cholerae TaxID=666 RepID=UPI00207FB527|nr:sugar transferase [Vibrio cholerae]GIB08279.1 sugar transferase [Vibrio cholerae]
MKRLFDFVFSFLLLIILFPILLVVYLSAAIHFKGNPIFSQRRPGLHGRIFTMYKFRSMIDSVDVNGEILSDDLRLTRFGKFLRSTSLDELPAIYNVLIGEMSFVGPRPLLVEYLPLYNQEQSRRHNVKPGITGWAQVNGRNAITWDEKFKLDIWYVDHHNLILDFKILFLTVRKVISRDGISAQGEATMSKFTGHRH